MSPTGRSRSSSKTKKLIRKLSAGKGKGKVSVLVSFPNLHLAADVHKMALIKEFCKD